MSSNKRYLALLGVTLICILCVGASNKENDEEPIFHEYCVIGAGPAGLQMGYFLKRSGRDYIIFEKSNVSGSFFQTYPRHRTLISINKRNTGQTNKEFNLRHDWNSLLSDDESLLLRHYSRKMFPSADVLLRYLDEYQKKLDIKVQFNTEISNIVKLFDPKEGDHVFFMKDQRDAKYLCRTLLIATGAAKPINPGFVGSDLSVGYEDIPIDGEAYEGKTVMILGRGNAAFETADAIYGNTNFIHMTARSRVRLSWSTHYVGDVRGVNNALLDTYQLKSLDAVAEMDVRGMNLSRGSDGRLWITPAKGGIYDEMEHGDNYPFRLGYDVVIRCLGFSFDDSIFARAPKGGRRADRHRGDYGSNPGRMTGRRSKYPSIGPDHQARNVTGLYFIGVISHGIDWRESAGGFIHGFRYTTRAVHRLLERRNHDVSWPHQTYPISEIIPTIMKRINEASGTYQMVAVLCDVYAISPDGATFALYEEFPVKMIHDFKRETGSNSSQIFVQVNEYGHDFSGPGADVFREGRAVGEPDEAHESNFLHPVFYYYSKRPGRVKQDRRKRSPGHAALPKAEKIHHIVEDFNTLWDGEFTHIQPLRRFIENALDRDLRRMHAEDCFRFMLMTPRADGAVPLQCESYLNRPDVAFNLATPLAESNVMGGSWVNLESF